MSDPTTRGLSHLLPSLLVLTFAASLQRSVLAQETPAFPEEATFEDMVELPFVGLLPDDPQALADPEAYFADKIRKWELAPVKLQSGITIARPPAYAFRAPEDHKRYHPHYCVVEPVLELLRALPAETLKILVDGGIADITAYRDPVHELLTAEDERGNRHLLRGMTEEAFASAPLICAQVWPQVTALLRARGPEDSDGIVVRWSEFSFGPSDLGIARDGGSITAYARHLGAVPPAGTMGWWSTITPARVPEPPPQWCDREFMEGVSKARRHLRLSVANGASVSDLAAELRAGLPHPVAVDDQISKLRLWTKSTTADQEVDLGDLAEAALACCWARPMREDPDGTVALEDLRGKTVTEVARLASDALGLELSPPADRADQRLGAGPHRPWPWTMVASMVLGIDWPSTWWENLPARPIRISVDPNGRKAGAERAATEFYADDPKLTAEGMALLGPALHRTPATVPESWRDELARLAGTGGLVLWPDLPVDRDLLATGWRGVLSDAPGDLASVVREAATREIASHKGLEHWASFVAFPVLNTPLDGARAYVELRVQFVVELQVCGQGRYGKGVFDGSNLSPEDLKAMGAGEGLSPYTRVVFTRMVY